LPSRRRRFGFVRARSSRHVPRRTGGTRSQPLPTVDAESRGQRVVSVPLGAHATVLLRVDRAAPGRSSARSQGLSPLAESSAQPSCPRCPERRPNMTTAHRAHPQHRTDLRNLAGCPRRARDNRVDPTATGSGVLPRRARITRGRSATFTSEAARRSTSTRETAEPKLLLSRHAALSRRAAMTLARRPERTCAALEVNRSRRLYLAGPCGALQRAMSPGLRPSITAGRDFSDVHAREAQGGSEHPSEPPP
jgi:hypothetical protein